MSKNRIKLLSTYLINKWHTNDPFVLAECIGIEVSQEYLGSSKGYYVKGNNLYRIHINNALDYPMRRAICGHELGHALLHTNTNIRFMTECTFFSQNRYEREANLFGAYLILNDLTDRLYEYDGYSYHEVAIAECVPDEYSIGTH